jgi:hypothetical protein
MGKVAILPSSYILKIISCILPFCLQLISKKLLTEKITPLPPPPPDFNELKNQNESRRCNFGPAVRRISPTTLSLYSTYSTDLPLEKVASIVLAYKDNFMWMPTLLPLQSTENGDEL